MDKGDRDMTRAAAAIKAIGQIGSILDEHELAVQGAVLAQVLAVWLMDHPKAERTDVLALHLAGMTEAWHRREKEEK